MNTIYTKLPSYLIVLLMPLIFWLISHDYSAPAYLLDEIGYLDKAAVFGGHVIEDGYSKYFGGYALVLAPLFAFFNSPKSVWAGIMIINALFWVGSFFLLNQFLTLWKPDISESQRVSTLFVAALYPTWVTMSGYAFPTCAFIFIFLCCVISLARWRPVNTLTLLPHSLCVGFLFWIHPTGLGVVLASIITVAAVSFAGKNYRGLIMHSILIIMLVILYKKGLEAWCYKMMNPSEYTFVNYPTFFSSFKKMLSAQLLLEFVKKFSGQMSYLIISSFGLILFGLISCFMKVKDIMIPKVEVNTRSEAPVSLFLVLSLLLVTSMGCMLFSEVTYDIEHFIFGRYVDEVVLPLLSIGFLTLFNWKKQTKMKCIAALIAAIFIGYAGHSFKIDYSSKLIQNLIDTIGFFPQYIMHGFSFAQWMCVGFVGVFLVIILGKNAALVLMMVSFFISGAAQVKWHQNILLDRNPALYDVVRENFAPRTCLGIDRDTVLTFLQRERFRMYSFFFYNYDYKRMSIPEWESHCNGPYLTFNPQSFKNSTQQNVVAREISSGLFLVVKNGLNPSISDALRSRGDVLYAEFPHDPCVINLNCYINTANNISKFSEVGVLTPKGKLSSTGIPGYLFYGPYVSFEKGKYSLILHGDFIITNTTVIDISGGAGKKVYLRKKICNNQCKLDKITMAFTLNENVSDLEVRLAVGSEDSIKIIDYKIVPQ